MRLALVCLSLFLLMGLSGACHYVLADEDDFAGMNEEWLRWFPANPPLVKVPGCRQGFPNSRCPSRPLLRPN